MFSVGAHISLILRPLGRVLTNVRQVGDDAGGDGQADFILVNVCGMEDLEQVLNCSKFNDLVLCWL